MTPALVAVAGLCALATVPLVVIGARHGSDEIVGEWLVGTFTPGFLVAGWWLLSRRPGMWIGRVYLLAGLSTAITGLAAGYAAAIYPDRGPGLAWAMWVVSITWLVHGAAMSVAMIMFPRSRPRGNRDWWLIGVGGIGLPLTQMLTTAVRPGLIVTTPDHLDGAPAAVRNPLGIEALGWTTGALDSVWLVLNAAFGLLVLGVIAVRWRRAEGMERRQYRWALLLTAAWGGIVPAVVAVPGELGPVLAIIATFAFELLVVVAILRWDVYEARVVLQRSALAASLLVASLAVYGVVVVSVALIVGGFGPVPATLGAMVAVFAFGPLSAWIARSVDRVFYGRRREPFALLASMGRGSAEAADPDDALDRFVAAIASELRFPAVVLEDADGAVLSAAGSLAVDGFDEVELEHLGQRVGSLKIAPRPGTDGVTDAERRLTRSLADAAAAVVAYRQTAAELEAANEDLAVSREAERRRYQRDLHDGLGPRLTAVVFKLDALANHLRAGRLELATSLLDDARSELTSGVDEIRTYIHALGNPTLATSGLRQALTDRVERMSTGTGLETTLDIRSLGSLSDSVQTAVLAVVSEAFTNVVRHAGARRCTIALHRHADQLAVSVSDDGSGICERFIPGIGLRSMRHRVEELGGNFSVADRSPGTAVSCTIPVMT